LVIRRLASSGSAHSRKSWRCTEEWYLRSRHSGLASCSRVWWLKSASPQVRPGTRPQSAPWVGSSRSAGSPRPRRGNWLKRARRMLPWEGYTAGKETRWAQSGPWNGVGRGGRPPTYLQAARPQRVATSITHHTWHTVSLPLPHRQCIFPIPKAPWSVVASVFHLAQPFFLAGLLRKVAARWRAFARAWSLPWCQRYHAPLREATRAVGPSAPRVAVRGAVHPFVGAVGGAAVAPPARHPRSASA
jgi:hypothetical protein